jgi:uncharacterized protein (TIGR03437 family)
VKILLAALTLAACLCAQVPNYTADGIVNGASFAPGPLAPNTIASLFGTNLSWSTKAVGPSDIVGNELPKKMGSVQVFIAGYPAHLYYVSPVQVNLLIPSFLRPGVVELWLVRDGMVGPVVEFTLQDAAPALFQTYDGLPVATHLDGSLITKDAPAGPNEIITLYANGLGCIEHAGDDGTLPASAEWLCRMDQFSVWIGGAPIDSRLIWYAGVAPGFAGLYQVNVQMPAQLPADPELRMAVGGSLSATGLDLPAK